VFRATAAGTAAAEPPHGRQVEIAAASMTIFILQLDLADHEHAHNPTAQRQIVGQMLDHARQAVCSGSARQGELILSAPLQQQKIGTWQFTDGEV
jgi:hypothetical protein